MIPTARVLMEQVETMDLPSKTYFMDENREEIRGDIDGEIAMRQAIRKILQTKRYAHLIYDWNYGLEIEDLYGKSKSFVIPELQKRIGEALLCDDRVESVDTFSFAEGKGEILVKFRVVTKSGVLYEEQVVEI